ncbi:MAG: Uma2 family endonuclease [Verrucomicrobiota bacterium]
MEVFDKPATRSAARPLTREEYQALGTAGILGSDVELLWGVIVKKMSKSPLHVTVVRQLFSKLSAKLLPDFFLLKEDPIGIENSEPEPDIAIVRGDVDDYTAAHPETAELVIEVALTSLEMDREKASLYATAEVPEYWIVNVEEEIVEIHTEPSGEGYRTVNRVKAGESMNVRCCEGLNLEVAQIFAFKQG